MKFLCVPCDQPMTLRTVKPPDRGSLSVLYSCPACGYEMAMLTNPYETQVVSSLGVRVGPEGEEAAAGEAAGAGASAAAGGSAPGTAADAAAGAPQAAASEGGEGAGRCPFSAMIPGIKEMAGASETAAAPEAAPPPAAGGPPAWTETARARLSSIPAFVRPMARTGIEKFARERGYATIDEKVLDEARAYFGM